MAYIRTIAPAEAEGQTAEHYAVDQRTLGYIANYTQVFSLRPDVYAAWRGLIGAIRSHLDQRRYELVTVAAASALRTRYCMVAHGAILLEKFFSPEEVDAIARDHRSAGLAQADVSMMDFAEKVVLRADQVSEADIRALRRHGLSDEEILDVALAAAARCFFAKTLDAMGAEPDAAYAGQLEPELLDRLSFGRWPEAASPPDVGA